MKDLVDSKEKFEKGWRGGLPETKCGAGSKLNRTVEQRAWLTDMVNKYGIRSVGDIGAGDMNWIKKMDWGVRYHPFDLVPRSPAVKEFDLREEVPPTYDALLVLWVLNHLDMGDQIRCVTNLKASKSKYLFITQRLLWTEYQPKEFLDLIANPIETIHVFDKKNVLLMIEL